MLGAIINGAKALGGLAFKAVTVGGAVAGVAGAVEMNVNGKDSFVTRWIRNIQEGIGGAGAQSNTDIFKTSLFSWIKTLGEFLMVITDGKMGSGLINFANRGMNYDSDRDTTVNGTLDANGQPVDQNPEVAGIQNANALTATGNRITAQNEITMENLGNDLSNMSLPGVFNSVRLAGAGAIDETVNVGALTVGHVLDAGDWASGKLAELVGIDTGFKKRDLSTSFGRYADDNLNFDPTLTTAFDRVSYGAGRLGSYLIPYAATSKIAATAISVGATAVSLTADTAPTMRDPEPVGP